MLGTILSAIGLSPARLIALGLAGAALVGGTLWVRHQISSAQAATVAARLEASQAREEQERLRGGLAQAEAANATSTATIARMASDREESAKTMERLEKARRADAAAMTSLRAAIDAARTDPASQAGLSPILITTVEAVQADRARRAAEAAK